MKKTPIIKLSAAADKLILPPEARLVLGWDKDTDFAVWADIEKNELIIKKRDLVCALCGDTEDLIMFNKNLICTDCREGIMNLPAARPQGIKSTIPPCGAKREQ